jgi:hypothetical protein
MTHILQQLIKLIPEFSSNIRSKTENLRGCEGPLSYEMSRLSLILDSPLTDGGEDVA